MALIKCTECGKEISDQAVSCPGCGAPVNKSINATQVSTKKKTSKITWAVLGAIILGLVWATYVRDKESSLPVLPIEVKVRDAMLGSGKVLQVKNTSTNILMLIVSLKNSTTKQEKSFRLDIPAGGVREIGHLEGWVVASGDAIEIHNDSYQRWAGSAP